MSANFPLQFGRFAPTPRGHLHFGAVIGRLGQLNLELPRCGIRAPWLDFRMERTLINAQPNPAAAEQIPPPCHAFWPGGHDGELWINPKGERFHGDITAKRKIDGLPGTGLSLLLRTVPGRVIWNPIRRIPRHLPRTVACPPAPDHACASDRRPSTLTNFIDRPTGRLLANPSTWRARSEELCYFARRDGIRRLTQLAVFMDDVGFRV